MAKRTKSDDYFYDSIADLQLHDAKIDEKYGDLSKDLDDVEDWQGVANNVLTALAIVVGTCLIAYILCHIGTWGKQIFCDGYQKPPTLEQRVSRIEDSHERGRNSIDYQAVEIQTLRREVGELKAMIPTRTPTPTPKGFHATPTPSTGSAYSWNGERYCYRSDPNSYYVIYPCPNP